VAEVTVRTDYLAACDVVRPLVASATVGEAWTAPSALDLMTVGDLVGHLLRAVTSVDTYLGGDRPPPGPSLDAPGYYLSVDRLSADLTSDLHRGFRSRATAEATGGHRATVERWDGAVERLRQALTAASPATTVAVLGGRRMTLDDYLVTRLVEVVVHADDLAASVGEEPPTFHGGVYRTVIDCLVEVAVRRHGPGSVVTALTRRERDTVEALRVV